MSGGTNKCFCKTCKKSFKALGIMSHRAMHRRKEENCTITYSSGLTKKHRWNKPTLDDAIHATNKAIRKAFIA